MICYVKVVCNASRALVGDTIEYKGQQALKVYLTEKAERGKANKSLVKLLAKHFGVAPSAIVIEHGEKASFKRLSIDMV